MLNKDSIKDAMIEVLGNIKFEYKVITTPSFDEIDDQTLNEFNNEGWELVNVVSRSSTDAEVYKMVFKRLIK